MMAGKAMTEDELGRIEARALDWYSHVPNKDLVLQLLAEMRRLRDLAKELCGTSEKPCRVDGCQLCDGEA